MIKTPTKTASLVLLEYYQIFPNLYFDEITKILTIKTQLLKIKQKHPQKTDDNFSFQVSLLSLPLTLFHSAFDKFHEHYHAGLHIVQLKFNQYYIPFLQKWQSLFIHDCIDCQKHRYKILKPNKAAILPFSRLSSWFNN